MDVLAPFIAVPLGVLAGSMLLSFIARWIAAIYTTVKKYRVYPGPVKKRELIWALPLAVLLHSGPWLLAIAGYLSYYAWSNPHGPWLFWFFGGAAISLILTPLAACRGLRLRNRRIANERAKASHEAN